MMYSQYLRIEEMAGGVACSKRQFIRSARTLLTDKGKSRNQRTARHFWIKEGLEFLEEAKKLVSEYHL